MSGAWADRISNAVVRGSYVIATALLAWFFEDDHNTPEYLGIS